MAMRHTSQLHTAKGMPAQHYYQIYSTYIEMAPSNSISVCDDFISRHYLHSLRPQDDYQKE